MIIRLLSIGIIFLSLLLSGCEKLSNLFNGKLDEKQKGEKKARVFDTYLYEKDISTLIPKGVTKEDSLEFAKKRVNNWLKQHLILGYIDQMDIPNKEFIENKVEEYRFQLINHSLESEYIKQKLDTAVSVNEIKNYYEKLKDSFVLRVPILRCIYLKIPEQSPDANKLKSNLLRYDSSKIEFIRDYAYNYADEVHLSSEKWIDFSDMTFLGFQKKPKIKDIKNALKWKTLIEGKNDEEIFLLRVLDIKDKGETAPFDFVKEQIRTLIINKRKFTLKQNFEDELLNKAKVNADYEIFN